MITWADFIPVGIKAVQIFLERNAYLATLKDSQKEMHKETLRLVYDFEIKKANQLLGRRFEKHDLNDPKDKEKHTGILTFEHVQQCLLASSWVTPKEINLILRDYVMKQGYEAIDIKKFDDDLYAARFELTCSRIMDTSMPEMAELICNHCTQHSKDGKLIPLRKLRKVLADCKQLCLTAFQIAVLVGFSEPDCETTEMMVDIEKFAKIMVDKIELMYSIDAMRRKA